MFICWKNNMCNTNNNLPNAWCWLLCIVHYRKAIRRYCNTLNFGRTTSRFALWFRWLPTTTKTYICSVSNQIMIINAWIIYANEIFHYFAIRNFFCWIVLIISITIHWNIISTTWANIWCWCICGYCLKRIPLHLRCIHLSYRLDWYTLIFVSTAQRPVFVATITTIDSTIAFLFTTNATSSSTSKWIRWTMCACTISNRFIRWIATFGSAIA